MSFSSSIVESLLAGLLQEVIVMEKVSETEEVSSLQLSFTSSPDHPLPCSEDFQFFFSIATTAPPHSPDDASFPCSGVTPPPSPPSATPHSCTPSPALSPPSQGVSLLPLSGQMMTQAVYLTQHPTHHHEEITNSVEDNKEVEPAIKRAKLEVVKRIDLLVDETEADLDIDEEDIEECSKASSDSDDDLHPFPLTFNTTADLMWKLQKAEILPAGKVLASQRPSGSGLGEGAQLGGAGGQSEEAPNFVDVIKLETNYEVGCNENIDKSGDEGSVGEYVGKVAEDDDGLFHEENDILTKEAVLFRPSLSMVSLLNKPPRLGLSKLYRGSGSLHDVSIIEKEKKTIPQHDIRFIEKEE